MLRDLLVVELFDEKIQRRLLLERTLTFNSAKEMALAMEIGIVGIVNHIASKGPTNPGI